VAKIFHADLHGLSGAKDQALLTLDIAKTKWSSVDIEASSFYFLIPQNSDLRREYDQFWKITEIMPVNSVGIVTARDALTVHLSKEEAWKTVQDFAKLPIEVARAKYDLGKDVQDWKVDLAQQDLNNHPHLATSEDGPFKELLTPILYRPFDTRYTYYTGKSKGFHCRARSGVMRHMVPGENLGLISARSNKSDSVDKVW
jgi:hypothetical protein